MKKRLLKPSTVQREIGRLIKLIENIRKEIEKIKARCSHSWQFESDPSGNNDSGYYCLACSAWRKSVK